MRRRRTVEALRVENARLRVQLDDLRHRRCVAAEWLCELLAMPTTRPGSHLAMHADGLLDELDGMLDVLAARGRDCPGSRRDDEPDGAR
jgi:hypothetical protein